MGCRGYIDKVQILVSCYGFNKCLLIAKFFYIQGMSVCLSVTNSSFRRFEMFEFSGWFQTWHNDFWNFEVLYRNGSNCEINSKKTIDFEITFCDIKCALLYSCHILFTMSIKKRIAFLLHLVLGSRQVFFFSFKVCVNLKIA